jgi:hypothetical protein
MRKLLITTVAVTFAAIVASGGLAAGAATKQVSIVHVVKGCHVWSAGTQKSAGMTVTLNHGGSLTVVNQDLDMHRLVQFAGPKVASGPFMMMNQRVVLRFPKTGVYRFHTKVADMRGMPEAETMGPDNVLVLTVRAR